MVGLVRGVVIALGVCSVAFAVFYLRTRREVQRSGRQLSPDLHVLLLTRAATYGAMGVCFVLAGIYRSQWFAWIGIGALFAKSIVEAWLRRRERASVPE